VMKTMRRRPRG